MQQFLSLDIYQQIIIIIGIIIIANILYKIISKFFLKFIKLIDKKGFIFKTKNIETRMGYPVNLNKIYLLLDKAINNAIEITKIELHKKIAEQMDFTDDENQKIFDLMCNHFVELLKKKNINSNDLYDCKIFRNYRHVTKLLLSDMLSRAKRLYKRLDMINMDEKEWKEEKERISIWMIKSGSEIITNEYSYTDVISREEIYQHNLNIIPDIRSIIHKMFEHARRVAVKYHEEKQKLHFELMNMKKKLAEENGL